MYTAGLPNARRPRSGHADRVEQCGFGMHHAHAAPAAASGRFDDDRVADLAGDLDDFLRVFRTARRWIRERTARRR